MKTIALQVSAVLLGFAVIAGSNAAGTYSDNGELPMNNYDKKVASKYCNHVYGMQFKGKATNNDGVTFVAYQFICDDSHYPKHFVVAAVKNNKTVGIVPWDLYGTEGRSNGRTQNFSTFKGVDIIDSTRPGFECMEGVFQIHGAMPDYHGDPVESKLGGYEIWNGKLQPGPMDCN